MSQLANPNLATLRGIITGPKMKEQFAAALPAHLSPERFCRVAITALTRTPKLADCTQESLFRCLLDLSAFGLEPDGRRAHLIPYGKDCTLVLDYKGVAELAMRSGVVSNIHADVVCENDSFEYDRGSVSVHKIDFKKPRGSVYAVYAICRFKDGTEKAEVMSMEDVEKIRKRSRAGTSGPWVTDFNEMAKKTVFRRLSKWLPLSSEFRDALDKDHDTLEERDVTPRTTVKATPLEFPSVDAPQESTADDPFTECLEAVAGANGADDLAKAAEWAETHLTGDNKVKALTAVNDRAEDLSLVWDAKKGAFVEP